MQLSTAPGKLTLPFANAGARNVIPVPSQIGITPGAASLTDGFPPLTRTPLAAGGVAPFGIDMNGILYEVSAIVRWANAGGGYPYDSAFANDSDIGGYPKGARIARSDGLGYWFNTIDNNTVDPEAAGYAGLTAGWVPDYTTGATAITMTNANVTLTALQYGKPVIVITGTLSANINLIFPAMVGQWIVINSTTGAFTITCKTPSGTGVVVISGPNGLIGDGVNIYGTSGISQSAADLRYAAIGNLTWTNTRLAKTANYTVLNADKAKTVACGGSAFFTITVGVASGFDTNFAIVILNEDTTRGKKIALNGLSSFILWPGQSVTVFNDNNVWTVSPAYQRWALATNLTIYVSVSAGNDGNDGLAAGSGNALATITKAISIIQRNIDCAGSTVTIQLANGTYTEQVTAYMPILGQDQFVINGDQATPSNVTWTIGASQTAVAARDYGTVTVSGVKFTCSSTGGRALFASQFGTIDFLACEFGTFTGGWHLFVDALGSINKLGAYSISGDCAAHLFVSGHANAVFESGGVVNLPNSLTFSSSFFFISSGVVSIGGTMSFTGAGSGAGSVGQKYAVVLNGVLTLNGTTLPGASAGATATGGQVV